MTYMWLFRLFLFDFIDFTNNWLPTRVHRKKVWQGQYAREASLHWAKRYKPQMQNIQFDLKERPYIVLGNKLSDASCCYIFGENWPWCNCNVLYFGFRRTELGMTSWIDLMSTSPCSKFMMTSSNGNIFRVTDHLCGKFTGPRWNPYTNASDAEL